MDSRKFIKAQTTFGEILVLDVAMGKTRDPDLVSRMSQTLFETISNSGCAQIVLDLKGIPFITSDVIGQLVMLHKKCQANDLQMKLCGVHADNRLALDMVRFDRLVDIHEHKPHAIAAFKMGERKPVEIDANDDKAAEYFKQAKAGDLYAQYRFAQCLETGRGVEQNFQEAIRWYEKAARNDHVDSQHALGVAYAFGIGVPQDFAKAFDWYKRAADLGHAESQYWIGVSWQYGLIGEVDHARALKWFSEAAEQRYQPALQAIAELRREESAG